MSKELIVSAGRHETRVAILEDDQVVELFHEREKEYSLAGSIHKGRVTRVLPGMQSAFVDIGLDRDAFLYVSDFFEDNDEYDAVVSTVEDKVLKMEKGGTNGGGAAGTLPGTGDRPEMVRQVLAVESPAAESEVAVASAIALASPPVQSVGERPADRGADRSGADRSGGDRGGHGRRGRRRRGGRGSGLPDSKFFSPRAETAAVPQVASATENESKEQPAEASSPVTRPEDDFIVLPGESLAKYSPGDSRGSAGSEEVEEVDDRESIAPVVADSAPEIAPEIGPEEEPAKEALVETALPDEHPLAGFGSVAGWVSPPAIEEDQTVEQVPTTEVQPPQLAEPTRNESVFGELEVTFSGEDEGLSAAEVAESEVAQEAANAVYEMGGASQPTDQPEQGPEEGPEPARIPTSLTAALREQGHRYPHRVSRRMRRKMRGGQPEGEGEKQSSEPSGNVAPQTGPRFENRVVQPRREERRPVEQVEPREPRQQEPRVAKERAERERPPLPSISDLLKEGQEIIVQIAKEPLGQKGARITSHIALPGRFVVYMPTVEHVGVSRKIPSDDERQRLKRVLQTHRQGVPGGFICRTAAENKSEEELKSDMHFLYNLWLDMRQKAEKRPAPVLLHHDLDLVQRILRDQLTTSFKTIWVDHEELFESILSFVQRFQPALVGRVKLYTRSNPIFDEFGITNEVEKALRPKVWLKSGGYIVINQTEALVAIDINTGKYVGKSNRLEDTIVKINTDAIKEIVRQIRLRDLGGIIVVDFIDMDERKNRQKVMLALEDSMRADRAPYKILQFNDFGLVAITRKRVKQSLERTLCAPCGYCEGAGYIKSVGTVVSEILQEAQKMSKALDAEHSNLVLRVNPEVAKVLKSNQNSFLQEIEEIVGKSVLVKSDPLLHQTKFDLA
jgi:ribonuclease G